jgi:hypothetical protein
MLIFRFRIVFLGLATGHDAVYRLLERSICG